MWKQGLTQQLIIHVMSVASLLMSPTTVKKRVSRWILATYDVGLAPIHNFTLRIILVSKEISKFSMEKEEKPIHSACLSLPRAGEDHFCRI